MTNSTYLSSIHINTLSKLHEIAKKHNCIINLEVRNYQFDEIEDVVEVLYDYGEISEKVKDFIIKNTEVQDRCNLVVNQFILTLRDRRTGKDIHNYHTYAKIEGFIDFNPFEYELDDDYGLNNDDWNDDLEEFFEDVKDGNSYYNYYTSKNSYGGWKGLDTKGDGYHTYRTGMHIKFFGDLVCDYLGEERIEEVY